MAALHRAFAGANVDSMGDVVYVLREIQNRLFLPSVPDSLPGIGPLLTSLRRSMEVGTLRPKMRKHELELPLRIRASPDLSMDADQFDFRSLSLPVHCSQHGNKAESGQNRHLFHIAVRRSLSNDSVRCRAMRTSVRTAVLFIRRKLRQLVRAVAAAIQQVTRHAGVRTLAAKRRTSTSPRNSDPAAAP